MGLLLPGAVSVTLRRSLFAVAVLLASSASAFDYLEHSYATDRACALAQKELAPLAAAGNAQAQRSYLVLALTCPQSWSGPYCDGGYKQAAGLLNLIELPASKSHDYAITLGDFAALQDHLSELGAVRGIPQASHEGLTTRALEWLNETGDAGGVVSDVAEDGCETLEPLDWSRLTDERPEDAPKNLPSSIVRRSPARKVVSDPAAAYSFDNPQYLDLVLHNHGHFGEAAFRNWEGLHATAKDLASARCEDVLPLDRGLFDDLADELPAFEEVRWRKLSDEETLARGCDVVAERIRLRLLEWARRVPAEMSAPVKPLLDALAKGPDRSLVSPFIASVFEGAGLHYLQDGLSSGHVRLDRSAYGLYDSRYQHDEDSRNGIPTRIATETGVEELVLFGDGYLLGTAESTGCDGSDAAMTACLLQRQRAVLYTSSTASLLDLAGTSPEYVRTHLLLAAPGGPTVDTARPHVAAGVPPNPTPPISYQSILLSTSVDAAGGAPEVGVRTAFLSALGARANWMTSYHVGLLTRTGSGASSQVNLELAYMFHWRWAARWLINMGPYAFAGLHGFGGPVSAFAGVGPSVGTSVLPEGWIHLPLEVTLSYRVPLRLYDGAEKSGARTIGIEAHFIELSVGLAFM